MSKGKLSSGGELNKLINSAKVMAEREVTNQELALFRRKMTAIKYSYLEKHLTKDNKQ